MARYIEKEALIKLLDERGYFKHAIYKSVIDDFPTADVVPKSEVEVWKSASEQLYKEMSERILEERKIERKLVAREIFEEIEKIIDTYTDEYGTMLTLEEDEFAELKNKYTESEGNI